MSNFARASSFYGVFFRANFALVYRLFGASLEDIFGFLVPFRVSSHRPAGAAEEISTGNGRGAGGP